MARGLDNCWSIGFMLIVRLDVLSFLNCAAIYFNLPNLISIYIVRVRVGVGDPTYGILHAH